MDNNKSKKAKIWQTAIPAARQIAEFDVTIEDIKETFFEVWPMIFNLGIGAFTAIQSDMCYTQAGIICIYLCGKISGFPNTDPEKHIISVFDAWEVAQQCLPFSGEEVAKDAE